MPALIDQIQVNLLSSFQLFIGQPGVHHGTGEADWFVSTNPAPGNQVIRTQITGDNIEERIDQVLAEVGTHADSIDWLIFPSCQPHDLGERLAARGMRSSLGGSWMLADLAAIPAYTLPLGVRIKLVCDTDMLATWAEVSAAGFGIDTQEFFTAYARYPLAPDADKLHFIAFLNDMPVSSSTLLFTGGIPGLYDISTPPALRGNGYATAVIMAMLQEAQRRGYAVAWLWASQLGEPVYRRLGFVGHDFGVREYRWMRR
jgi:GNAT superfamily N-acetyltransferase